MMKASIAILLFAVLIFTATVSFAGCGLKTKECKVSGDKALKQVSCECCKDKCECCCCGCAR